MTTDGLGIGEAAIIEGETQFSSRDAVLLEAIEMHGSVNRAATELERSHARALRRIETLEKAFGPLVERKRGGSGGGGSHVTPRGRTLLDRFHRLSAAIAATAAMEETVLQGQVSHVSGELADVDTPIGMVRGVHEGVTKNSSVQVRIASDALTVHTPEEEVDPDATSARNRCDAVVHTLDSGDTVHTLHMMVKGITFRAQVTSGSLRRLGLTAGTPVVLSWKATATRLIQSNSH